MCSPSLSCVQFIETLWTVACQALSTGFPRQEYWSGLPFLLLGDLPDPGIKTCVSWVSCIGRWVRYHLSHLGSPVQLQWLILSFHFSSDCKGSSWALLKGQWTSHWPDWISLQALTWNGFWDMGWNKLRPPLQILVFNFVKGKAGQC